MNYSAEAIESYISALVYDLQFPMTDNLLAQTVRELCYWFDMLRDVENQRMAA